MCVAAALDTTAETACANEMFASCYRKWTFAVEVPIITEVTLKMCMALKNIAEVTDSKYTLSCCCYTTSFDYLTTGLSVDNTTAQLMHSSIGANKSKSCSSNDSRGANG